MKSESQNPRALDRDDKPAPERQPSHVSSEEKAKASEGQKSTHDSAQGAVSSDMSAGEVKGAQFSAFDPSYAGDLPESYGETSLVLLAIDPYLVHAYWDLTPQKLGEIKQQIDSDYSEAEPSLRFYEASQALPEAPSPAHYFDVDVQLEARNWYVHLWSPDKTYRVDLGLRTGRGSFVPLAKSNEVQTPPAWPAMEAEEHYMRVEGEYPTIEIIPQGSSRRPDQPITVGTVDRSNRARQLIEGPYTAKPARPAPAGPADLLPEFERHEGGFPSGFPNTSGWMPPAESTRTDLWEKEHEAHRGFESSVDLESAVQNATGLTPEFPLPFDWLESKPPVPGAEQGGDEARAASTIGLQNLLFADRYGLLGSSFDICSRAERALALGISSGFRTKIHMHDTSGLASAESAPS